MEIRERTPFRKEDGERWYLVDAAGKTLGRVASRIALILQGKHRPDYTPHLAGDHVVVVNAERIKVTGKKLEDKVYHWHTGWPGGLRSVRLKEFLARHPERVIERAVRGMLPKNYLSHRLLRRLKVYRGPDHPHEAQKPERVEL